MFARERRPAPVAVLIMIGSCVAIILPACSSRNPEPVSQAAGRSPEQSRNPRTFGGQVLEVRKGEGWFVMQGGGSKRYPQVRMYHDRNTRWTGVPRRSRVLTVGDSVRVHAIPRPDGTFRATSIELQERDEAPAAAGMSGVR